MTAPTNITDMRFGRLVAVRDAGSNGHRRLWLFRCACGNEVTRTIESAKQSKTASCGCWKSGYGNRGRRPASATHGMTNTRLHSIWGNMRQRCGNPNNYRYDDYGGRGIRVCEEWNAFEAFAAWASANGYADNLQIDRIDNDRGYSPDNCRWVTAAGNMANQRKSLRYVVFGEEMGMAEIESRFGIRRATFRFRVEKLGLLPDEAATLPRIKGGAPIKHGRYAKARPKVLGIF
jgi:hypothetical protein